MTMKSEFYKDVREKKSIASSARHRKCGRLSKHAGLPHDGLSEKELNKLNGKVVTYNMKSPMTWEQFKALPTDLMKDYIEFLKEDYEASPKLIADGFGISAEKLKSFLEARNIDVAFKSGRRSKITIEKITEFFSPVKEIAESAAQVVQEIGEILETPVEPVHTKCVSEDVKPHEEKSGENKMRMNEFTLSFSGPFNSSDLLNSLRFMIKENSSCNIQVRVTK